MAERPGADEIAKWHRFFAVECNNRGWNLVENERRGPGEDIEMLHCAHASAFHWGKVGTASNVAKSELLLAFVHAMLGYGAQASRYAQRSLDFVMAHSAAEWELAFAHAAVSFAAAVQNDAEAHLSHYNRARKIGDGLSSAEEREIFLATFRNVPAP